MCTRIFISEVVMRPLLMLRFILNFVETKVKGCYAVSVSGRLPPGLQRDLRDRGFSYRSRDTSQKT